jgi:hypothetical protein
LIETIIRHESAASHDTLGCDAPYGSDAEHAAAAE